MEIAGLSAAREVGIDEYFLWGVDGAHAGHGWVPTGERASIGTHPSNQLVLADPSVARFHCELRVASGQLTVRDLGGPSGTRVDGQLVIEAPLHDGSRLVLGTTTFEVRSRAASMPPLRPERGRFSDLVGRAPAMRAAFALLERACVRRSTTLLEGEPGTGKTHAARALHREARDRHGPMVVVDSAGIPASLLECELFGHEAGALGGSESARLGAFEIARGGAVLIDEIGELPLELQAKLLRAIERGSVRRMGSEQDREVDVQVVASTRRDLRADVNGGRFRADLYRRLVAAHVTLPPLRDRPEDVGPLTERFLDELGATAVVFSRLTHPDAQSSLARDTWPGNVRELRNHLERVVALEGIARGVSLAAPEPRELAPTE